jgi:ABC-2 type transport system ATP-binding protein
VVANGTLAGLKRLVPGGRIRLELDDAQGLDGAVAVFRDSTRDEQALALDVPSGGELTALRALLDRVDREQLTSPGADGAHPRPRRRVLRP